MVAGGIFLSACVLDRGGALFDDDPTSSSGSSTSSAGGSLTVGVGGASSSTSGSGGATSSSSSSTSGAGGQGGMNPLGNGVIDPGEECDDGNLVPGDGCDPQGLIEAGWDCPQPNSPCLHVSGFTAGAATSGGAVGSMGGSPYSVACGAGQVLVGVRVYDASGCSCATLSTQVGSLVPICAEVSVDMSGSFTWAAPTSDLAEIGGALGQGALLGELTCTNDRYLIGVRGRVNDDPMAYGEVESIRLRCARFSFASDPMGGTIGRSAANSTGDLGADTPDMNAICAGDRLAVGLDGHDGALVDQVDVQCALLTPTYCGDGNVDVHESCDDGNAIAGDGCDTVCQSE